MLCVGCSDCILVRTKMCAVQYIELNIDLILH